MQRIYGTAWAKKEDLDAYLHMLEEAEKRDHAAWANSMTCSTCRTRRRVWFSGIPKGWAIWQEIEQYMRAVYRNNGYQEVRCPQILDKSPVGKIRPLGALQGQHVLPPRKTATTRSSR